MAKDEPFLTGASIYQQLTDLRTDAVCLKTILGILIAHLVTGRPFEEEQALRLLALMDGLGEDDPPSEAHG